jgi:formylglycine-generating enzyme required for sulfatase activity
VLQGVFQIASELNSLQEVEVTDLLVDFSWLSKTPQLKSVSLLGATIEALIKLIETPDLLLRIEELSLKTNMPYDLRRLARLSLMRGLAERNVSEEIKERILKLGEQVCRAETRSVTTLFNVNGVAFNMVLCPAGTFWMGSQKRVGRDNERPRHQVELMQSFWMSQMPVTQGLYQAVMGATPSHFKGDQRPVEQVSWFDAVRFCNALSELERLEPVYQIGSGDKPNVDLNWRATGYRLPTEAEWEYTAKAGTELTYAGSNSIDEVAWYYENSNDETHPVGQKKVNAWNLNDMSGNVFEWCNDEWSEGRYQGRSGTTRDPRPHGTAPAPRVSRSGGWWYGSGDCRVACRDGGDPDFRGLGLGFRFLRLNFDS